MGLCGCTWRPEYARISSYRVQCEDGYVDMRPPRRLERAVTNVSNATILSNATHIQAHNGATVNIFLDEILEQITVFPVWGDQRMASTEVRPGQERLHMSMLHGPCCIEFA